MIYIHVLTVFICLSQYVCHAEVNAILNKNSADVRNCSVSTISTVCIGVSAYFASLVAGCKHICTYM